MKVKTMRLSDNDIKQLKELLHFLRSSFLKCSFGDFMVDDGVTSLEKAIKTLSDTKLPPRLAGKMWSFAMFASGIVGGIIISFAFNL